MWNLRNKTNEQRKERNREINKQTKTRLLNTDNKLLVARGEMDGCVGEINKGE